MVNKFKKKEKLCEVNISFETKSFSIKDDNKNGQGHIQLKPDGFYERLLGNNRQMFFYHSQSRLNSGRLVPQIFIDFEIIAETFSRL